MKVKIGKIYPDCHWWSAKLLGWNSKRKVSVRIDKCDTWSMDNTLAYIIHPMLVQLKATQHGHPANLSERQWDDTLDEMIWAFKQKMDFNWEDQFYGPYIKKAGKHSFEWIDHEGLKAHQKRMTAGFKLFGIYYENLWD